MAEIDFFEHLIRCGDFKDYISKRKSSRCMNDNGKYIRMHEYFDALEDIYIEHKDGCLHDIQQFNKNEDFWKRIFSSFKEFKQCEYGWDIDKCLEDARILSEETTSREKKLFVIKCDNKDNVNKFINIIKNKKGLMCGEKDICN